ncbi:MAG: hypothetical protein DMG25_02915 [Acidobacteria bacterium]|nr:MAG: hypothetical protein DMG25_02915 [Acidobacteriota bacterium]
MRSLDNAISVGDRRAEAESSESATLTGLRRALDIPRLFRSRSRTDLGLTVLAQLSLLALGALTGVLSARVLGPQGRGELAALTLWPLALISLATLGMNQSIVFHSGRNLYSLSEIWTSSAVIGLGQSLAVILVGLLVLPLALRNYSPSVKHLGLLFLVIMPLLLFQGSSYPANIVQGKLDLDSFNLIRLLPGLAYALGLTALWWLKISSISYVVASQILGLAVATVFGYWIFLRKFPVGLAWHSGAGASLLRFGWQNQAGQVSSYVNQRLDQLILSLFIAPRQLGLYAVAVTVSSAVCFIPQAIGVVTLAQGVNLTPELAKTMISKSFRRSLKYLLLACAVLFTVAPWLITLAFGSRFSDATLPCRILLCGMVGVGAAQVLYDGARALGQPLLVFYAEGLSMVVTVVGLCLLLPRYGIVGAAITSTVAYCSALGVTLALYRFRLGVGLLNLAGGASGVQAEPIGTAAALTRKAKLLEGACRRWAAFAGTPRGLFRVVRACAALNPRFRRYQATLVDGSEICVDLKESMCFPILLHGCIPHEVSEAQVLERSTREGDVFVDVGANVGFYTALARRWVGLSGTVVAFEPNPNCVQLLRQSFGTDPNVLIIPSALGKEKGTGQLCVPYHGDRATLGKRPSKSARVYEVAVDTLDDFLRQRHLPSPSVVKIDCEGMEYLVLQGMEGVLKTPRPPVIAFEYIEPLTQDFTVSLPEIIEFVQEKSGGAYQFFRIDYAGKLRDHDLHVATAQNDLVAVPSWRQDLLVGVVGG